MSRSALVPEVSNFWHPEYKRVNLHCFDYHWDCRNLLQQQGETHTYDINVPWKKGLSESSAAGKKYHVDITIAINADNEIIFISCRGLSHILTLSIHLSVYSPIHPSIYKSPICPSIHQSSIYSSLHLSVNYLSLHPSIHQSSICPFISWLSICQSIFHRSICLSTYLSSICKSFPPSFQPSIICLTEVTQNPTLLTFTATHWSRLPLSLTWIIITGS